MSSSQGHSCFPRRCQSPAFLSDINRKGKPLRPINLDCNGLQNQFQQQYCKIGNIREQLFHAWRLYHFDKNTETLDSYITCIG